jgi:uncharacterized protein YlxW (UPF0749 family)
MSEQYGVGANGTSAAVRQGPVQDPPAHAGPPEASVSAITRAAFGVTLGLLAAALVIAAESPAVPTAARSGRRLELGELIEAEQRRVDTLAATVTSLRAEVAALQRVGGEEAERIGGLQDRVDVVATAAGLSAVRGPGLITTLRDSPLAESPDGDPNDLLIHEQDLQAIINALWAGGAEAMSVNGQRVLTTTAIRCIGNTLLLHGRQYSPPYSVEAIGNRDALLAALDRDPAVERFRHAAQRYQLGLEVVATGEIESPASEDLARLDRARIARDDSEHPSR